MQHDYFWKLINYLKKTNVFKLSTVQNMPQKIELDCENVTTYDKKDTKYPMFRLDIAKTPTRETLQRHC